MNAPNRRSQPATNTWLWGGVLVLLLVGILGVAALWGANLIVGATRITNPVLWLLEGAAGWTPPAVALACLFILLLGLVAVGVAWLFWRSSRARVRVDSMARFLASPRDLAQLETKHVSLDTQRLDAAGAGTGVPLGEAVLTGRRLWSTWEWCQLHIMGPRAGKTSCVVVPQMLETTGPVVATSNKRDIVDLTRGPRSGVGPVWVNDPQGITDAPASWWWNPLSFVTTVERADELASLFASAARDSSSRTDAYFDPAGQTLLSNLLLAAAVAGLPITSVYEWLNDPSGSDSDPETSPSVILYRAGHRMPATSLDGFVRMTTRQRDGVYGTALGMTRFLRNPSLVEWITPPATPRRQFSPADFVRSRGTLYLLSKEGEGSARAITAALTVAVTRAAEEYAVEQGGRLRIPLLCELDEAANICRWPELPNLYSHYGSRGIVLCTYLQSWSQGVTVWGQEGMEKLWSASNVRGIGSGLAEGGTLDLVTKLVGSYDVRTQDVSRGRHGESISIRNQREGIFEAADIAALPRGRELVFTSGLRPILLRLVHWSAAPYAEDVAASERYYRSAPAEAVSVDG